jgi:hypothetical protein
MIIKIITQKKIFDLIFNHYRYICNDPTKKVIDTTNPQNSLYNSINATCMINGKYSIDVTNFGCIGKNYMSL